MSVSVSVVVSVGSGHWVSGFKLGDNAKVSNKPGVGCFCWGARARAARLSAESLANLEISSPSVTHQLLLLVVSASRPLALPLSRASCARAPNFESANWNLQLASKFELAEPGGSAQTRPLVEGGAASGGCRLRVCATSPSPSSSAGLCGRAGARPSAATLSLSLSGAGRPQSSAAAAECSWWRHNCNRHLRAAH